MKTYCICILIILFSFNCIGQKSYDAYWDAAKVANKHYDNAEYKAAAEAYAIAFKIEKEKEIADHRLFAAASNCMNNNEIGVKENLFELLPVSTKNDMKKVLVNYEIFNKYKNSDWWKELKEKMDKRLAYLIARHKNLKIFKAGRNVIYRAIRINELGDTLANTTITMKPDGTGWGHEAATLQSQVIYEYQYSSNDSLEHIDELDKIVTTDFWLKRDTTGVIENDQQVWMHPFRHNEFFKTELAPFPKVIFPISEETMKEARSKIMILKNWGTYTHSETENEYFYLGKENKNYSDIGVLNCHKFQAKSFNNFHGSSEIQYLFHEDLGFVEMTYKTYDNDMISFVIESVAHL